MRPRVLIVGSGGREHALVRALLRSASRPDVLAAPGNPGIAAEPGATCVPIRADDLDALVGLAVSSRAALTIVGPEAPLVAGLADRLRAAGLAVLGPNAAAAALEGSKAFAKEVMRAAGIPTAEATAHIDLQSALDALAARAEGPVVVKADGLAAGKGVVVAPDRAAAEVALRAFFVDRTLGDAASTVLLEDFLPGEEASVIALCDGEEALLFPAAQDHKRLGAGDTGPNTGGMGAYAPAPVLDAAAHAALREALFLPVLREMARRGAPFRGFLFAGLMIGPEGWHVLEFNVRLGDPEAQVLLALLDGDPLPAFLAAAAGSLAAHRLPLASEAHAACVVVAAEGYPGSPVRGAPIPEPEALPPGLSVLHAGTRRDADGTLRVDGGRVLGVVGVGPALARVLADCQAVVAAVRWPGAQHRPDIGRRALERGS